MKQSTCRSTDSAPSILCKQHCRESGLGALLHSMPQSESQTERPSDSNADVRDLVGIHRVHRTHRAARASGPSMYLRHWTVGGLSLRGRAGFPMSLRFHGDAWNPLIGRVRHATFIAWWPRLSHCLPAELSYQNEEPAYALAKAMQQLQDRK